MDYPQVKVLSPELSLLGFINNYTSLRLKRSWQGVGDFEIHTPVLDPEIIKIGNIIMLDNARKNGIITGIKSSFSSNKLDITITGTTLNGLASRRIVLPFANDTLNHLNGGYFCCPHKTAADTVLTPIPAETIIKSFAKQGFGFGDQARNFSNLAFGVDRKRGNSSLWRSRYEQLDEVLQAISEYCDIGWEIYPVLGSNKYLLFNVIMGVDRSCSQSTNSRVIISKDFGSAADITYTVDVSGFKNVAYAGGVGEDADRTVVAVSNEVEMPTGYDRYEIFEDCGTLEIAETDEDISLSEEGKHKLLDYAKVEALTATLTTSGSFAYGEDYDLGDIVTVADRDLGIEQDMRLTEVEECYEPATIQIRGVLGNSAAHLGRVIRSLIPTAR